MDQIDQFRVGDVNLLDCFGIFRRREIDEWRDRQIINAAKVLNDLAARLVEDFEEEARSATWNQTLISPDSFIAERVAPKVREHAEPVIGMLLGAANSALRPIVEHEAVWFDRPSAAIEANSFEGIADVALSVGPLAGGVATAAALPTMAVTSTTAFFGLVTTTAISWPVVVGGGAVAAVAIGTGLLNTSRIMEKATGRLRRKIAEYVGETLLKGRTQPSLLEQFAEIVGEAAVSAERL